MTSSASAVPVVGGAFRCSVPVRWGDLDAQNHVNNTVYFRYVEEARVQLFQKAGLALASNKVGMLAHASLDFLKPVLYPATVVVELVLTRVGRSSMDFDTVIACRGEPGVVYAKGRNVIVGADIRTGRSTPWTPDELAAFAHVFTLGPRITDDD